MTTGLPRMTARAIAVCTVLGIVGFTLFQVSSAFGAIAGIFVALSITGFTGSLRQRTLSAALLVVGVLGAVGAIAVSGRGGSFFPALATETLGFLSVCLGLGFVAVTSDSITPKSIDKAAKTAFVATLVGVVFALVALQITQIGGLGAALFAAMVATGNGIFGVTIWILATTTAAIFAILIIPVPSVDSTNSTDKSYRERKRFLAVTLIMGVVTAVVSAVLMIGVALSVLPPVGDLLVVRAVLVVLTAGCLTVGTFGIVLRVVWDQVDDTTTDIVPSVVGSSVGVVVTMVALGAFGVDPAGFLAVPAVLGLAGVGLFVLPSVLGRFESQTQTLPVGTGIAITLVFGAILIGTFSGRTTTLGSTELGSLLALGAGLFTFELGSFGRQMTREVGVTGSSRLPQLVRIGWIGGVVGLGVTIAAGGLQFASMFAPTQVVPAAIGIAGALLATISIAWVLARSETAGS